MLEQVSADPAEFLMLPKGKLKGYVDHPDPSKPPTEVAPAFYDEDVMKAAKRLQGDSRFDATVASGAAYATQAEVLATAINSGHMPDWHPEIHKAHAVAE